MCHLAAEVSNHLSSLALKLAISRILQVRLSRSSKVRSYLYSRTQPFPLNSPYSERRSVTGGAPDICRRP